jgi:hypothetical protein
VTLKHPSMTRKSKITNYSRGSALERRLAGEFRRLSVDAIRAAGSKGKMEYYMGFNCDIVILHPCRHWSVVQLKRAKRPPHPILPDGVYYVTVYDGSVHVCAPRERCVDYRTLREAAKGILSHHRCRR